MTTYVLYKKAQLIDFLTQLRPNVNRTKKIGTEEICNTFGGYSYKNLPIIFYLHLININTILILVFRANISKATELQTRSRRKAAKMLVAVVIMFAISFLPVHIISVVR